MQKLQFISRIQALYVIFGAMVNGLLLPNYKKSNDVNVVISNDFYEL